MPLIGQLRRTSTQEEMPVADDADTQRLIACLVADEAVIERFPTVVRYLLVGLFDEPAEVMLVVPDHPRARTLVTGPIHVITHRRPTWLAGHWVRQHVVGAVRDRVEQARKDDGLIVHGLSLTTAPMAASIASATGADLVLNVTSTTVLEDFENAQFLARANALIAPTESIARAIRESHAPRASLHVVPIGIISENAPAAFSHPGNAPSLIFAGVLRSDSGVDVLLRAVKHVIRDHPDLQVFISGKGPAETDLRMLAASLGLAQNLTFTGRLDRLRTAMRSADLFCLPAALPAFREEPIHALAAGLVLIAAEGCPCDGLVDQQNALLFKDRDEVGLAQQINHALENPQSSRVLAATGQALARSRYSVSRMIVETMQIYRELLRRRETLPLA